MNMKPFYFFVVLVFFFSACGKEGVADKTVFEAPDNMQLTKSEIGAVSGVNSFGFELLDNLNPDRENIVISPLSISLALAMAETGAKGKTAEDMSSSLGLAGLTSAEVDAFYYKLTRDILQQDEKVDFTIANSMWINTASDIKVRQQYCDACKFYFNSDIFSRDFTNSEGVTKEINAWISDNTAEKIKNLLFGINPGCSVVLANAVYFKAGWGVLFDPDTKDSFNGIKGNGTTDFLNLWHYLPYVTGDKFRMVVLPYNSGQYNMAVVLPSDKSVTVSTALKEVSLKWSVIGTKDYPESEKRLVDFKMPSFSIEYYSILDNALDGVGLGSMFNPEVADFSGLFDVNDGEKITLGQVKHGAVINVDRNGTEAAAATYVSEDGSSGQVEEITPIEFYANRPFGFIIFEKKAGSIIFIGTKNL